MESTSLQQKGLAFLTNRPAIKGDFLVSQKWRSVLLFETINTFSRILTPSPKSISIGWDASSKPVAVET